MCEHGFLNKSGLRTTFIILTPNVNLFISTNHNLTIIRKNDSLSHWSRIFHLWFFQRHDFRFRLFTSLTRLSTMNQICGIRFYVLQMVLNRSDRHGRVSVFIKLCTNVTSTAPSVRFDTSVEFAVIMDRSKFWSSTSLFICQRITIQIIINNIIYGTLRSG